MYILKLLMNVFLMRDESCVDRVAAVLSGVLQIGAPVKNNVMLRIMSRTEQS